jgi:hypothetical protein
MQFEIRRGFVVQAQDCGDRRSGPDQGSQEAEPKGRSASAESAERAERANDAFRAGGVIRRRVHRNADHGDKEYRQRNDSSIHREVPFPKL